MHYFLRLCDEEIANLLGVPASQVKRYWEIAKLLIRGHMRDFEKYLARLFPVLRLEFCEGKMKRKRLFPHFRTRRTEQ